MDGGGGRRKEGTIISTRTKSDPSRERERERERKKTAPNSLEHDSPVKSIELEPFLLPLLLLSQTLVHLAFFPSSSSPSLSRCLLVFGWFRG
jgi:hypothetical protein